jgi:hypothetical protein
MGGGNKKYNFISTLKQLAEKKSMFTLPKPEIPKEEPNKT